MSETNIKELAMRIREFVEHAASKIPIVIVAEGVPPKLNEQGFPELSYVTPDELLQLSVQHGSQELITIFSGWCIARKVDLSAITPDDIFQAMYFALHGELINLNKERVYRAPH